MDYSGIPTVINHQLVVSNFLAFENRKDTLAEIFDGLNSKKKFISSRFFYDDQGSSLFEEITTLQEYYPTRTEKSILRKYSSRMLGNLRVIIELGSGDCTKISLLLETIPPSELKNILYVPVDISRFSLIKSADILSLRYPGIKIHGLLADFLKHITKLPGEGNRLICFLGSTIGNLTRNQSLEFLKGIKSLMHPGDRFLLGMDMTKDIQILEAAYNDKRGITAAFNKNILNVLNQYAGTDFNPDLFEHLSFYNRAENRIEMHLMAVSDMIIKSPEFSSHIFIRKGETIHTENSHKYTLDDIRQIARHTGWNTENVFTDCKGWYSLVEFSSSD